MSNAKELINVLKGLLPPSWKKQITNPIQEMIVLLFLFEELNIVIQTLKGQDVEIIIGAYISRLEDIS